MTVQDTWSVYERWNDAIAEVVYPVLEQPEPVYLDFEDVVIEGLSARTGVPVDDVVDQLVAAVRRTMTDAGPAAVFERHVHRMRRWVRGGRKETPPFLAVLAVFCVAAERMSRSDGMAATNYLGRLRLLLGWEDKRLDQAYRRVAERFWGELNRWLLDLDGARGTPTAFALSYRYVGLTMSQALVRGDDRERFLDFFQGYGFAPGTEVPPASLVPVLGDWIQHVPCPVSSSLATLWGRQQTRERIAQSAAVALAGWDGRVRERSPGAGPGGGPTQGQLSLTLEVGGFPRKRFAVQALFRLPRPGTARDATVVTSEPPTDVELVPDIPGALGLGRGSSLHAQDVLEGLLQVRDSLTGQVVERRPRRVVVFREDELSRRWIETPQVMLGDDVRLLVRDDVRDRVQNVLEQVARPGWQVADALPGQPGGWSLFSDVEVLAHPGSLVATGKIDDLLPLVPLTSTSLKIAGGFAVPGQVRGKWHAWAPPEIRAVSDAPGGFVVRVVDLGRSAEEEPEETTLEEWGDDGTGVVLRSMADLGLEDGDYRVEVVPTGSTDPLTATVVRLRSADTPDQRQWAIAEPVFYGPGVGALGLPVDGTPQVRGHVVTGGAGVLPVVGGAPAVPGWSSGRRSTRVDSTVVRLAIPDAGSCLFTGRHKEHVETVPHDARGRPLVAWSTGRCRVCGLVRRYPTRLPRRTFEDKAVAEQVPVSREVAHLGPSTSGEERDWATALDALLHVGGGPWGLLEKIAYQIEPSALFLDQFARTLEVLGHIDVRRDERTLQPTGWEVAPTSLSVTERGALFAGYWPGSLYYQVTGELEEQDSAFDLQEQDDGPASYYALVAAVDLARLETVTQNGISVVDRSWGEVASALPLLSEVSAGLPRRGAGLIGDTTWFQPRDNTWVPVGSVEGEGAFRVRRFSTLDVFRSAEDVREDTVALSTVHLSKHLAGLAQGVALVSYDPRERRLTVPLGADLPGLYGRAAVAASGLPPTAERARRLLHYQDVPPALADQIHHLLTH